MLRCAVFVMWCFFISVKGETTGFDIVRPTPVMKLAPMIQSTDASNPLKANMGSEPKFFSTGISDEPSEDVIVNPTPVLLGLKTTDASTPLVKKDVPLINLLTTRPILDNLFLSPRPVINVAIMETSAENPSIRIKEEGPTPALIDFQTTGTDLPSLSNDVPLAEQLTTRPVNINLIVSPSPVLNTSMLMEINADNPLFRNKVNSAQLNTTIAENDKVLPTPVLIDRDLETNSLERPTSIALINEDILELLMSRLSTGTLIEPSQVMDVNSDISTSVATPNLEHKEPIHKINLQLQEPIQASSTELINHSISQSVIDPCKCSFYKEITLIPTMDSPSHETGIVAPKDLNIPEAPKMSVPRPYPPPIILQHIVSLQLNLFFNNIMVLEANPPRFVS